MDDNEVKQTCSYTANKNINIHLSSSDYVNSFFRNVSEGKYLCCAQKFDEDISCMAIFK